MDATISERLRKGEQLLLILLSTQCLLATKYCVVRCDTVFFVWSEVSISHAYSTSLKLPLHSLCSDTHF